jgi:hypothetical protein
MTSRPAPVFPCLRQNQLFRNFPKKARLPPLRERRLRHRGVGLAACHGAEASAGQRRGRRYKGSLSLPLLAQGFPLARPRAFAVARRGGRSQPRAHGNALMVWYCGSEAQVSWEPSPIGNLEQPLAAIARGPRASVAPAPKVYGKTLRKLSRTTSIKSTISDS